MTAPDMLPVAIRAFLQGLDAPKPRSSYRQMRRVPPSEYTLVFDTETATDAAQQIRFGTYQVRKDGAIDEAGIFYDPESLTDAELTTLRRFADRQSLRVRTVAEFIDEVFYPVGYELRALIVGFNLPFDISRLAVEHASARGKTMRGGFTFQLSRNRRWPRLHVKHLSQRAALIRFAMTAGNRAGRGMRRRRQKRAPRRGFFIDVKTLAAALTSRSFNLAELAEFLGVPNRKLTTEQHGGPLTEEYLTYAERDPQATWECFIRLRHRYAEHGLAATPVYWVYSEAGLGKAYLREMGITPWRQAQPDADPTLIGTIMGSYYGGRSEVRIRRDIRQVAYCDFLSMYPTVCILMDLWRFVTAEGFDCADATAEARTLLSETSVTALQRPELWRGLPVLVQVLPAGDLFPVRSQYGQDTHYTIGLNRLTSRAPLWFTLADCMAATILGGKVPNVVQAIRFTPRKRQAGLRSVAITGNAEYRIDPNCDDFYRRLIELRAEIKHRNGSGDAADAARLDAEQQAIKILANSTSYGIFVELNVDELAKPAPAICHGSGEPFVVDVAQAETPGRYFHPLLATLITGAARLMLAITERLILDQGLEWACCDTDSMVIAKPLAMQEASFLARVGAIRDWFRPLNPYAGLAGKGSILKLEGANYDAGGGNLRGAQTPLYCFAVSPKRYALFNCDPAEMPVLRKASAHGLGHLRDPYGAAKPPPFVPEPIVQLSEIGVDRWQHDFWYRVVSAALAEHPEQVALDDLPNFGRPAVSRYAATTPTLLRWFKGYNRGKPYREQVRPFGFLLAFQAKREDGPAALEAAPASERRKPAASALSHAPRAVAPFDPDPAKAAQRCFDRDSGKPVPARQLKTYQQALLRYHLHPDPKCLGARYADHGPTGRRHVEAVAVHLIGKEANRWEEQFHLGEDPKAQSEYGMAPGERERALAAVREAAAIHGVAALARVAAISRRHISAILAGRTVPTNAAVLRLSAAAARLAREQGGQAKEGAELRSAATRIAGRIGQRELARRLEVDQANLSKVLAGRRKISAAIRDRLAPLLVAHVNTAGGTA